MIDPIYATKRASCVACAVLAVLVFGLPAQAADWPAYRHDARRGNASGEGIDARALEQVWMHRPAQPPRPAWHGPARWDAYVKRRPLSSMRDYDESFHATVAGNSVFFGSSADDSVHCLDLRTGKEQWRITVGGPVRMPPTWHEGRLYFGSDDGCMYCVEAADGAAAWSYRPAPPRYLINDGRLVSQWPCRTGVLVEGGLAYAAFSMLPWEKSYVCAVHAGTGKLEGPGSFARELDSATLEGPLLLTERHILACQGRAGPRLFDKATGKDLGGVPGAQGGSFGLAAEDGCLYFGPGPKEGFISESDLSRGKVIARKFGALAVVAAGNRIYAMETKALGCLQREPEAWLWRRDADYRDCLVLAGDTLLLGGDGKVAAARSADGAPLWRHDVEGRAQGIVVANGAVLVSTDRGVIYCFRPRPARSVVAENANLDLGKAKEFPTPATARVPRTLCSGPILQFIDPRTALVRWQTAAPMATVVTYGLGGEVARFEDLAPKTAHEAKLEQLLPRKVYTYSILFSGENAEAALGPWECDTHLNYCETPIPEHADPYADRAEAVNRRAACREILRGEENVKGLGIVIGAGSGELAYELAKASGLKVVGLETDTAKVAEARRRLQATGMYGSRVSMLLVERYDKLSLPGNFANVVLVEDWAEKPVAAAEVFRLLRPGGGRAWIGPFSGAAAPRDAKGVSDWLAAAQIPADCARQRGPWRQIEKPPLAGAGWWSHQYGRADNATYAGEQLNGATCAADFGVQWIGKPGPRHQSDRGNRKPAPLCTAGRLFVQGLDRLTALDAYNGSVLWSLEIPDSCRFNVRNDSANWCADDEAVYLAARGECWRIATDSGRVTRAYQVPSEAAPDVAGKNSLRKVYDWGHVASQGGTLIGSAVREQSAHKEFWGGQYWYTDPDGPLAAKVCSDVLFALDKDSGRERWRYRRGKILNTSIVATADAVFLAESRHAKAMAMESGRIGLPEMWDDLHLVALGLERGERLWERKLDVGLATTMFSMAHGEGRLVAVGSAKGRYRVAVFRAADGAATWQTDFPWEAQGKGGDSARPALVEGILYISPRAFDLQSGRQLPRKLVRGACGSYAAAQHVFVTRLGNLGLWAPAQGSASSWFRLRPDCWLSTIPAAGLILSPEGGGGCSCGGWLETSIAFAPRGYWEQPPRQAVTEEPGN